MDSYLVDASSFRGQADKVLVPAGEPELIEIVREAVRESIPVTISGGRTGLTGGSVAQGGWVVSLEKFRRLEIEKGRAIVGAGVALEAVQTAAHRTRQFYAPDPTERTASVGGNDRDQRQRLAQFALWEHTPARVGVASDPDGWSDSPGGTGR